MDPDELPDDVTAQAVTEDTPDNGGQTDGSQAPTAPDPTEALLSKLEERLSQRDEALRRSIQSASDKAIRALERRISGDPGQRAAKVAKDLGIQMTPEQETKYLESLRAAGVLVSDPANEQEQPQSGAGEDVATIQAQGDALFQSLGLQPTDPEAQWLYSARFNTPQAWLSAIQAAGDAKSVRLTRTARPAGAPAQTQPGRQTTPAAVLPPSGKPVKRNPSWQDAVDEEFNRFNRGR